MSEQARPGPRRVAKQERSLTTVDAILRAAELVLVQEGYERTSTKAIADLAGVSVGSLYQYFSNRDALVAALIDRRYARLEALVAQGLEEAAPGATDRERLCGFVETFVAAHLFEPALQRALLDCADRVGRVERAKAFERRLTSALARSAREAGLPDPEGAAFVLARTLISSSEGALRERLPLLQEGSLARELAALAARWLEPRPSAPPPAGADRLGIACEKHLAPVLGPTLAARALESAAAHPGADGEQVLLALAPILEVFLGISHTRLVLAAIRKELAP